MSTIVLLILVVVGFFVVGGIITSVLNLLISAVIWGITGWLASRIMGGDGLGIIGNVLLGIIGGFVGTIVLRLIGMAGIGDIWLVGTIIVGVVGGVVVIFLVRLLTQNKNFGREGQRFSSRELRASPRGGVRFYLGGGFVSDANGIESGDGRRPHRSDSHF